MRINTNVASMTAMESSTQVNKNLTSSLEKLSSGLRINKASDDASGMAIADKLRTQASALRQSIDNANNAASMIQIADKAMAEQSNILDIIKTKLIQAATSTTSAEGREAIRKDIAKLQNQLDNIADQTNYNGTKLLQKNQTVGADTTQSATRETSVAAADGINQVDTVTISGVIEAGDIFKIGMTDGEDISYTAATGDDADAVAAQLASLWNASTNAENSTISASSSGGVITLEVKTANIAKTTTASATNRAAAIVGTDQLSFQIGELSTNKIEGVGGVNSNTTGLGLTLFTASGSLTSVASENEMARVDSALNQLNTWRSDFGSTQNQLESSIRNMMTTQTNIKAAESVIRDVDYAAESANFNKQNIIAQAGTFALSQANQVQQNVLKLLQ